MKNLWAAVLCVFLSVAFIKCGNPSQVDREDSASTNTALPKQGGTFIEDASFANNVALQRHKVVACVADAKTKCDADHDPSSRCISIQSSFEDLIQSCITDTLSKSQTMLALNPNEMNELEVKLQAPSCGNSVQSLQGQESEDCLAGYEYMSHFDPTPDPDGDKPDTEDHEAFNTPSYPSYPSYPSHPSYPYRNGQQYNPYFLGQ